MTASPTQWMPTAPQGPREPPPGNGRATAGFCLAVVGLLVGFVPVFGFLVTVPALLLSRAGRRRFHAGLASEAGLSGAGTVLAWIGTVICALMTVVLIAGAGNTAPTGAPAPTPVTPPVPVLLAVPNVVGMGDLQARDTLRTAGFTNVVLGPPTGSFPGVPAGTVTTQVPGAAALASAGDPIVLGEATEPPAPVVAAPVAPVTTEAAPTTQAPRPFVAEPDVDVDRPRTRSVPVPVPSGGSSSGSSSGASFANCSQAKAAGAAPLYAGSPGYSRKLDRDGDGVACE